MSKWVLKVDFTYKNLSLRHYLIPYKKLIVLFFHQYCFTGKTQALLVPFYTEGDTSFLNGTIL